MLAPTVPSGPAARVPLLPVSKLGYTRAQAAEATGASLHRIKEAVSTGELPARKIGRQWIITAESLRDWIRR